MILQFFAERSLKIWFKKIKNRLQRNRYLFHLKHGLRSVCSYELSGYCTRLQRWDHVTLMQIKSDSWLNYLFSGCHDYIQRNMKYKGSHFRKSKGWLFVPSEISHGCPIVKCKSPCIWSKEHISKFLTVKSPCSKSII